MGELKKPITVNYHMFISNSTEGERRAKKEQQNHISLQLDDDRITLANEIVNAKHDEASIAAVLRGAQERRINLEGRLAAIESYLQSHPVPK